MTQQQRVVWSAAGRLVDEVANERAQGGAERKANQRGTDVRQRTGEPDLLVWWLLVEDVGAVGTQVESENSRLATRRTLGLVSSALGLVSLEYKAQVVAHRVLNLEACLLPCLLYQLLKVLG